MVVSMIPLSPFNILINRGSSSIEVFLKNFPLIAPPPNKIKDILLPSKRTGKNTRISTRKILGKRSKEIMMSKKCFMILYIYFMSKLHPRRLLVHIHHKNLAALFLYRLNRRKLLFPSSDNHYFLNFLIPFSAFFSFDIFFRNFHSSRNFRKRRRTYP